jgi:hypothetical protein
MDIHDKQPLRSKRLPSNPIAYADMEEEYNKKTSSESEDSRNKKAAVRNG